MKFGIKKAVSLATTLAALSIAHDASPTRKAETAKALEPLALPPAVTTTNIAMLKQRWIDLQQGGPFVITPDSSYEKEFLKVINKNTGMPHKTNSVTVLTLPPPEYSYDLATTSLYFSNKIPKILDIVEKLLKREDIIKNLNDATLAEAAGKLTQFIEKDPDSHSAIAAIFSRQEFKCAELSTIFAASFIAISRHTTIGEYSITLVSGLVFHPQVPYGFGHQWVELGAERFDPTLTDGKEVRVTTTNDNRYIRVAEAGLSINPAQQTLSVPLVKLHIKPSL